MICKLKLHSKRLYIQPDSQTSEVVRGSFEFAPSLGRLRIRLRTLLGKQILGAVTVLKFLQSLALDFPCICLNFSGNQSAGIEIFTDNFESCSGACSCKRIERPQIFFSRIISSEVLVYNTYFLRKAFLRKLFDIRFSYKHCNFLRAVCLLVKKASKTVIIKAYSESTLSEG